MLKRLVVLCTVLCLLGCSSQSETHVKSQAATVESQIQPASPELRRLERDLILNLWLHTKSEEERLAAYLKRKDLTPEQRDAAQILLVSIQQQANETWLAIFEE